MKRKFALALTLLLVATFAAACSGAGGAKATISLVENPWPASELNVAVAKIIIEKELGNSVEIIALDENAQWDALAAGDVDASLEVWPSGHTERIAEYIDNLGTVENGGLLGPVGEIGWFVPTYVIDANPALATWEGYKDAAADSLLPRLAIWAASWVPIPAGCNTMSRSLPIWVCRSRWFGLAQKTHCWLKSPLLTTARSRSCSTSTHLTPSSSSST